MKRPLATTCKTLFAITALSAAVATSVDASACTRVLMNQYPGYVATVRNLDFFGPVDPALVITPRGIARTGGDAPDAAHWTTRYGSVAIYADGAFPMDGMNEKGLAGHTLFYTNGSQAQQNNRHKPVLESRAWLSYVLDNYANVDEAVKGIRDKVRLEAKQLPIDYASDAKHLAIEDASGDSAVIEIDDGKVKIYHGRQYRVMTNPPSYDRQLANVARYANAKPEDIPTGLHADQRFVRANFDLNNLPRPQDKAQAQGFLLSVAANVAYPLGQPAGAEERKVTQTYSKYSARPEDNKGIGTYWTTIADLSHDEYHFKSVFSSAQVWVSLRQIDFDKGQPVKRIDHLNDYGAEGWEGNVLDHAEAQRAPA